MSNEIYSNVAVMSIAYEKTISLSHFVVCLQIKTSNKPI